LHDPPRKPTLLRKERMNPPKLVDVISTIPIDRDWSEGYPEQWEYQTGTFCENYECEKYNEPVVAHGYGECKACGAEFYTEGPMMNYAYPLPGQPTDKQIADLASLPLCVVHWNETDECELALTGGGMDLSWEICEAYIRLDYYPPVHFCTLPRMGNRGESADDRTIVAACKESAEIAARWAQGTADHLSRLEGIA